MPGTVPEFLYPYEMLLRISVAVQAAADVLKPGPNVFNPTALPVYHPSVEQLDHRTRLAHELIRFSHGLVNSTSVLVGAHRRGFC